MQIHLINPEIIKGLSALVIQYPHEKIIDHLSKYQEYSKQLQRKEDYYHLNIFKPEEREQEEYRLKKIIYDEIISAMLKEVLQNDEYIMYWERFRNGDFTFDDFETEPEFEYELESEFTQLENTGFKKLKNLLLKPFLLGSNKLKKKTKTKLLE